MATFELSIDLDDGLGPVSATVGPKERPAKATGPAPMRAPRVVVTRVPIGIATSYAPVYCAKCGSETREFRGIFLEERLSNGVLVLSRRTMRELVPFANLPRRFDRAPAEVVDLCPECFAGESAWREAIAQASVQAELPWGEEDKRHDTEVKREAAIALLVDLDDGEAE